MSRVNTSATRQAATVAIVGLLMITSAASIVVAAATPIDPVGSYVELDGNVIRNGASLSDWDTLRAGVDAHAHLISTVTVEDTRGPDLSYHAAGDKDTDALADWGCSPINNPQDKTDILNTYAAYYLDQGASSPYVYFGFERATNNGNSFMGFWFLQSQTSCAGNGAFTGRHYDGDLLILSNFTNGGTRAGISIYKWQGTGLVFAGEGGECPATQPTTPLKACAKANAAAINAPWSTTQLKTNTFLEGGLNLRAIYENDAYPCFATYLAETRTSQSVTATLKDFASGSFSTCDVVISIAPPSSVNPVGATQLLTITVLKREGTGDFVPAVGAHPYASLTGVGGISSAVDCVTDASGTCTVTATSSAPGFSTVTANVTLQMGLTPVDRVTNGLNGNSAPALLEWTPRTPSVVTTPSAATAVLGSWMTDGVVVAGDSLAAPVPTGTVDFVVCGPAPDTTCVPVGTATLVNGVATSPAFRPMQAGAYCFQATYSGDSLYEQASESSPDECFTISPAPAGIATTSTPGHARVAPGTLVTDVATLSGVDTGFPLPTGTVTFALCGPSADLPDGCADGATVGDAADIILGQATSPAAQPTDEGRYCWRATYSGDSNYLAGAHTDATLECFTVAVPALTLAKGVRNATAGGDFTALTGSGPGETVEFLLSIANVGSTYASAVVVTDTLDAALLPHDSDCADAEGQVVTWTVGQVDPGATFTCTFTATVTTALAPGLTSIQNVAIADSNERSGVTSSPAVVDARAAVDLSIVKTADRTEVPLGGTITYTLTYRNDGNASAGAASLLDLLPADALLSALLCDVTVAPAVCDIGELGPGESGSVDIQATLLDGWLIGDEVLNQATLQTQQGNVLSNVVSVLVTGVDSSLSKAIVDGASLLTTTSAAPGATLVFRLTYTNDGNIEATNVAFSDPLPPGMTRVSGDCSGTTTVTCALGTVPAASSVSRDFSVILDATFPEGLHVLANQANATTDQDATPVPSNLVLVNVDAPSDIDLEKLAASPTVPIGGTIDYAVTYWNAGTGDVTGMTLTDTLPLDVDVVTCDLGCDTSVPGVVTWTVDIPALTSKDEPAGIVHLTLALGPSWLAKDIVGNDATLGGKTSTTTTLVLGPDSGVSKLVKGEEDTAFGVLATAIPGGLVQVQLTYTNEGNAPAQDVILTDVLDRMTRVADATDGCSGTTTVTCALGNVPGDESRVVTFLVEVDALGFAEGLTTLHNDATGAALNESFGSAVVDIVVTAAADLKVLKLGDLAQVSPTGTLVYTILYWNEGDGDATGRTLLDTLPPAGFATSSDCTVDNDARTASCPLPTIPAYGDQEGAGFVTITLVLDGTLHWGDTVLNRADLDDATSTWTATVFASQSQLEKLVRLAGATSFVPQVAAGAGDAVEFQFTYENVGNGVASDIVIVDALPMYLSVLACDECADVTGNVLTWELPDVPAGGSATFGFSALVDTPMPAGLTTIENVATGSTKDEASFTSTLALVDVTAAPRLNILKIVTSGGALAGTIVPGSIVTYSIDVWNDGTANATMVDVWDVIPVDATLDACSDACAELTPGNVSWVLFGLDVGEHRILTLDLALDEDIEECTICNTASASSPDALAIVTSPAEGACVIVGPDTSLARATAASTGVTYGLPTTPPQWSGAGPVGSDPVLGLGASGPTNAGQSGTYGGSSATVTGIGADTDSGEVGNAKQMNDISAPSPGSPHVYRDQYARYRTLVTTSVATVVAPTPFDATATALGTSQVTDVTLLNGLITAEVIRAEAKAIAGYDGPSTDTSGSYFEGLRINGKLIQDVQPNTRVELPGIGYVILRETVTEASVDGSGQYAASATVTMIHVYVTNPVSSGLRLPAGVLGGVALTPMFPTELEVAKAAGQATFPRPPTCEASASEASATTLRFVKPTNVPTTLRPVTMDETHTPEMGGVDEAASNEVDVQSAPYAALANSTKSVSTAFSYGSGSYAQGVNVIQDLCIRLTTQDCYISASAVRVQSTTTANAAGHTHRLDDGVQWVDLKVGTTVVATDSIDTTLTKTQKVGDYTIVFNEKVQDGASLLYRAVHVTGPNGFDLVVGEASSTASWSETS